MKYTLGILLAINMIAVGCGRQLELLEDFDKGSPNPQFWALEMPMTKAISGESALTLIRDRIPKNAPSWMRSNFNLRGDFEVVLAYSGLQFPNSSKGNPSMSLVLFSRKQQVSLAVIKQNSAREEVRCMAPWPNGRQASAGVPKQGSLILRRSDTSLIIEVADEKGDRSEISSGEFGGDTIDKVEFQLNGMFDRGTFKVNLDSIAVRADAGSLRSPPFRIAPVWILGCASILILAYGFFWKIKSEM